MPRLSTQNIGPLKGRPRQRRTPKRRTPKPMRWAAGALALILATLGVRAAPPAKPAVSAATSASELASVLKKFDSLMDAGASEGPASKAGPRAKPRAFDQARALCTGGALRMFPFLALTQTKLAGLIDTTRSTDTNLQEKISGDWGAVKVMSHVVFKQPFLGQTEMTSVQAVHLFRSGHGWLIAEFEELENEKAPLRLRSGKPAADSAAAATRGGPGGPAAPAAETAGAEAAIPADLFPVSPRAPDPPVEGDSMRYRLRLKNGGSLADLLPRGPSQSPARALSPSEWILVNRRVTPGKARPLPDSLKRYLASNEYLDARDSLLVATERRAVSPGGDPAAAAGDIYRWVSGNFRFSLGAVLFGTSREALRGMTGDCSEAAVLTAALLRAAGVPSRVALGFASVGRGVFIGHAWAEAWLGQWVGVDAALDQYPAGVERIKLAELDGSVDMRIAATNLMLAALSNLDVEILDVWKDGEKVPLKRIRGNASEGVEYFERILKGADGKK